MPVLLVGPALGRVSGVGSACSSGIGVSPRAAAFDAGEGRSGRTYSRLVALPAATSSVADSSLPLAGSAATNRGGALATTAQRPQVETKPATVVACPPPPGGGGTILACVPSTCPSRMRVGEPPAALGGVGRHARHYSGTPTPTRLILRSSCIRPRTRVDTARYRAAHGTNFRRLRGVESRPNPPGKGARAPRFEFMCARFVPRA